MNVSDTIDSNINLYGQILNKQQKQKLAKKICEKVNDGDVIGFGSGSTSFITACEIADKIKKENIKITAIPTSYEIKMLCTKLNIPTASLIEKKPDWSFDGADEVSPNNWLIKGRGAAMFKEKLNIKNSEIVYILVDESKFVKQLCDKHPIPIECFPEAINYIKEEIIKLGGKDIELRLAEGKDGPIITENGNFILDVKFDKVTENLESKLKSIVGVIETGLFIGYDNIVIVK